MTARKMTASLPSSPVALITIFFYLTFCFCFDFHFAFEKNQSKHWFLNESLVMFCANNGNLSRWHSKAIWMPSMFIKDKVIFVHCIGELIELNEIATNTPWNWFWWERERESKRKMEIMKFCYLCFDRTKEVYPVVDETFMQKFLNFSPGNLTVSAKHFFICFPLLNIVHLHL